MKTPVIPNYDHRSAHDYFLHKIDGAPDHVFLPTGHVINTRPLRAGKEIDLIGLSNHDQLLLDGLIDHVDVLSTDLEVSAVYVRSARGYHVAIDVTRLPQARFVPDPDGNSKDYVVDLELLHEDRVVSLKGRCNVETGRCLLTGSAEGFVLKATRAAFH